MLDANTAGSDLTIGDIVLNPKQQLGVMRKSIQAFIHGLGDEKTKIQAFSGSSDLPELTKDVFTVTNTVNNFDIHWQNAFRGVRLGKGELSWEIADVATGLAFEEIPEGGKIKYESVSGNKVIASILKYGTGLGLTWEIIEGRKLYAFINKLEQLRAKLYDIWGTIHYGLLATAAALNAVAWQGSGTNLERDIETINYAANLLADANKDKGYGDTANARLIMFVSPKLRARMNAAFRATSAQLAQGGTANGEVIDFNIDIYYTYTSQIAANKSLLVLPGQKIQNSVYLRELGLTRQEIESLSQLMTWWTAFGAVVADTDQCYQLSFA